MTRLRPEWTSGIALTLGTVRGWAISRLHLSPAEFGLMRPGVFWEAIVAWQADKEADRRHVAEVIRGVGVRLYNIQLKPKYQITDVRKFLPLPWDEGDEDPEVERLAHLTKAERDEEALAFMEKINFDK